MTRESDADALDAACRKDRARLPELRAVLDELAFETTNGLRWRYIPGGAFVMGDDAGDLDERPAHEVTLAGFYMSEAPIAVDEIPDVRELARESIDLWRLNPFPREPRPHDARTPIVAITFADALQIAGAVGGALPTEAQWERAARGARNGALYPWGDDRPDETRACFHVDTKKVQSAPPARATTPNDYGLFAMAGGVWEWCLDHYDACAYRDPPKPPPPPPSGRWSDVDVADGQPRLRVIRGGSFLDGADALRVSFRAAARAGASSPLIGVRAVRSLEGRP